MSSNPGNYDVARLFNAAYMRTASVEKGVNGFKSTGIWPYNPDVFGEKDYMPAEVTDTPLEESNGTANTEPVPEIEQHKDAQPEVPLHADNLGTILDSQTFCGRHYV